MVWNNRRPVKKITPELGLPDNVERDLTDATRSFMKCYAETLPEQAEAELGHPYDLPYRLSRDFLDRHGARLFRHAEWKWPEDSVYLVRRVAEILCVQYTNLLDNRRRKRPVSDIDEAYGGEESARDVRSWHDADIVTNEIAKRAPSPRGEALQGSFLGVDFASGSHNPSELNQRKDQETHTIPESPIISISRLPPVSRVSTLREHTSQPHAPPRDHSPPSTGAARPPPPSTVPNPLNDSFSAYFTPTISRRSRPRSKPQLTSAVRKPSNLTDEPCSTSSSDTALQNQRLTQAQFQPYRSPTFTVRCGNQAIPVLAESLAHVLQSAITRLEWQRSELSLVVEDTNSRAARTCSLEANERALTRISELPAVVETKLCRGAV